MKHAITRRIVLALILTSGAASAATESESRLDGKPAKQLPPPSTTGLILDLDANAGLTLEDGDRVAQWENQVADAPAKVFIKRDEGRKKPGSGRPTLRKNVEELNGHNALQFLQQELVCMDEDAFDYLTQGGGATWMTVISARTQGEGLKDVKSFFGNLKNSKFYGGFWGGFADDNTLWWSMRNGKTFGRFDKNNPQLFGPKLDTGTFYVIAGRIGSGTDEVKLDLFVNEPNPIASSKIKVNPKENPSRMAIGQERDAIQHPGRESFRGDIARFMIFDRPLSNAELASHFAALKKQYGGDSTPALKKKEPVKANDGAPNIILIFTDDQGYEDLGCFGSKTIKTPNIDRMAAEGLKLSNFYAQAVCGVSRAALMTGSYPIRVAEPGNMKNLHTVPHPKEITMAEVLKSAGYATGLIGKWHLAKSGKGPAGFDASTMPNAQGFDYFYGTPRFNGFTVYVKDTNVRSPIMRNQEVVVPAVQSWDSITGDYTKEALQWIEQNTEQPFFLYLAHNMPHVPVGASENFKGTSAYGPYGDTIEEIDWSTGKILDKLKELGIDDNTLVIYTSDNGPWVETTRGMQPKGEAFIPRDHSGSAHPLRGWKMSSWDGGCKVPFIARWPKKIAAARESNALLSTMDLLPTFAHLAGATLPTDRTLDGHNATDFLLGSSEASPRNDYFYYSGCLLTGVRVDQWKLVLPRKSNPRGTGWWGRMIEEVKNIQLFDLEADPGETKNVAAQYPEVVARLQKNIEAGRKDLGDLTVAGTGARSFDPGPRKIPGVKKK